jgi:hypothetical protein
MALNFPDNPITNSYYTDTTSGFTYQYNGTAWISVGSTSTTQIKELDNISGSFNGSTQTFSLTIAGSPVYPVNINQITINLGGILQNAGQDFTLSGSEITFTTPPASGLSFVGMFYGSSISLNVPQTGSIGTAALSTGGPIWNTGGDVRVAGIITVGSSSVTIDGVSNRITVGTGATISLGGITAGVVTATSFYGDGSNLTGIGIGTTSSVSTSGIITASFFYGAGIGLTNIGGRVAPILYSPGIGQTNVGVSTNIVITFNKPILSVGNTITLREGSASGTITESFNVGISTRLSISGGVLTIDPTSNLGAGTTYYVVLPDGAYKDILNTSTTVGISSYYFVTSAGAAGTAYGYYSAGSGGSGYMGIGLTTFGADRSSPVQIPGTQWSLTAFSETGKFSGGSINGGVTQTGELYTWGLNSTGALGLNDRSNRSFPTQVPGTQWRNCFVGPYASFATKTDGTAWCWGSGSSMPLNDAVYRSSPTQIPGTQWTSIRSTIARNGGLGFKSDNTIWLWGYGDFGDFGVNDAVTRSSPHQIPGTQWSNFSASNYVIGGIKTDGTLWVWGYETSGSHGDNGAPNVTRSSPYQIPGTQWRTFSASYTCLATKTDGTLWSWGYNGQGGSALNDLVSRSSPHQIPGTQWGQRVDFAALRAGAFKTDNTLWVWGNNANGALGLNNATTIHRSSPTQIPGTQWKNFGFADSQLNFIKEL